MAKVMKWCCVNCGSTNVMRDAYVAVNDPEDVRTFDATVCEDCGYDGNDGIEEREVEEDDDAS